MVHTLVILEELTGTLFMAVVVARLVASYPAWGRPADGDGLTRHAEAREPANTGLSARMTAALAVLVGLYHGYLNGSGMGQLGTAAAALLGLVCAVFVLVALVAALVVWLSAEWARIAVRVAGSWIAASGFLLLGWVARKG